MFVSALQKGITLINKTSDEFSIVLNVNLLKLLCIWFLPISYLIFFIADYIKRNDNDDKMINNVKLIIIKMIIKPIKKY